MNHPDHEASALLLARACLAGPVDLLAMRANCAWVMDEDGPWLVKLTADLISASRHLIEAKDVERLSAAISRHPAFLDAFSEEWDGPRPVGYFVHEMRMLAPPPALESPHRPDLPTPGHLARWLGLSISELDWLADIGSWRQQRTSQLCHYRYRWVEKSAGGFRLLEIPKSRLLKIQRQILHGILDAVPVHTAAHGCVAQRSIVTNALVHSDRAMLMRIDLTSFFHSVRYARVQNVFKTLGYPTATARYLAALTTSATPPWIIDEQRAQRDSDRRSLSSDLRSRHLPQGAPSSPALANLCAWRLDLRLANAADASQLRYSRYVDDLFFSGSVADPGRPRRLIAMIYTVILEEGFEPNYRKTRTMTRARAQRAAGLVVNAHPNISRIEFDRLKATLTNCARLGPGSQNRLDHADFRAHLLGRVSFCEQVNVLRGKKLRSIFERIRWEPALPVVTSD